MDFIKTLKKIIYLISIVLGTGAAVADNNHFTASIFSGNSELDPASVKTAGQYISLHQVLRPLTQLNREGQIEGQLVKSWRIKQDFKEFVFTIDEEAKWSDGSDITSKDVKKSLDRQVLLNSSNHFDFSNVQKVEVIDDNNFRIVLKTKNVNFVRQVSYPEFGLVFIDNTNANSISFNKTSGAYSVLETAEEYILLKKNPFYGAHTKTSPETVKIEWGSSDDKYKKAKAGNLDFLIPFSDMGKARLDEIIEKNFKETHPHIGYSFWVTINPKSEKLKDLTIRRIIQTSLNQANIKFQNHEPFWEKAEQLYLPDGQGRPTENEIRKIWEDINKIQPQISSKDPLKLELKFLVDEEFPFKEELIETLKKVGVTLVIDEWASGANFYEKIQKNQYDLIQTRNDFSSIDLHENLQTTFNPLHPLIITDVEDNQFQTELQTALNTEDGDKRQNIYKEIAKKILRKGYIVPVAYHKVIFVHKKNVDISSWSTLFPEISLWKINIKK